MSENRIITLLTDFGLRDSYVGILKGVIAQIDPLATVIDITHQIPPQNVTAGRFCLMNAYPYFPSGTVHVAVVDPGVGSQRRAIAVQFEQGYLVAPDNGLISGVLSFSKAIAAVSLTNTAYWRVPNPSSTFHGRDIFASVGAYLARGIPLQVLGDTIDPDSLVQLPLASYQIHPEKIIGTIQYIDTYGNLITNIPANAVDGKKWSIYIKESSIEQGKTYNDVAVGEAVSLIGSHNWVEIAVNGGDAQAQLNLNWGDSVSIIVNTESD